ncbi:MAG: glycosyl hydrolase [Lachnospiraceae bacterium]
MNTNEYNRISFSEFPLTATEVPDNTYLTAKQEDNNNFLLEVPYTGFYDLCFQCCSNGKVHEHNILIDGLNSGAIRFDSGGQRIITALAYTYLKKGSRRITIAPGEAATDFFELTVRKSNAITEDTYKVTAPLSNPDADDNTRRLYKFLCDIYGKYSLTGQYAAKGRDSVEWNEVEAATGRNFAVLGMDVGGYDLTHKFYNVPASTIEYARDFYVNEGGIVQFCWHWSAPMKYVIDEPDNNHYWWNSFYKEHTTLNLDKIMNGEDEEGHALLTEDMHNMAAELEFLRNEGVPVLWRPLHEAAGGWFWWGNCTAESCIKLWKEMYHIMTKEHNLTNLIWMWNGIEPDWYPGDEYVDIVSADIYQGNHVYTSFANTFVHNASIPKTRKLVALSENGCVMDPDLVMHDNVRWLFWGTWSSQFTIKDSRLNEEYTEKSMLKKAYNHERTLTLDELPDLKNYSLD